MSGFIPDLGGWKPADLMRLARDIVYREECYRKADPDLVLEDSLPAEIKPLIRYGKQIANNKRVRISEIGLQPKHYEQLGYLIGRGLVKVSTSAQLLEAMIGRDPSDAQTIASELGLLITGTDDDVRKAVDAIWEENPKPLQDYLGGKETALGAVIGGVMKRQKGLNPADVRAEILKRSSHG